MALRLPTLAGALLVLSALAAGPVHAAGSLSEDILAALEQMRTTVRQLDTETDPSARAVLLRRAIEADKVVETFVSLDIEDAALSAAAASLREGGLQNDQLQLSLVEALTPLISDSGEGLQADLEAKAAIAQIKDPAYRAAGRTALMTRHMALENLTEAERLAQRIIEDASAIERPATRDAALRAAVLLTLPDAPLYSIAAAATDAMSSASARAGTYQAIARDRMTGSSNDDALAAAADQTALPLIEAVNAARAMSLDDDRRNELLLKLFTRVHDEGLQGEAIEIAKSLTGDKVQDNALSAIIDGLIARGRPLRGIGLADLLNSPLRKADTIGDLAEALDEAGYHTASRDILRRAIATDNGKARAKLVAAMANIKAFDDARSGAETLTDAEDRSFAYSRLAKRLADDGLLQEALDQLGQIGDADDLSYAQSGIGKLRAASGDIEGAVALLPQLTADDHRDRVNEAIAQALIKKADLASARPVLEALVSPVARARTQITFGESQAERHQQDALAHYRTAVDLAREHADMNGMDEVLAEAAVGFYELGAVEDCMSAIKHIGDPALRDAARARIGTLTLKDGEAERALEIAGQISDIAIREQFLGKIYLADFNDHGDLLRLERFLRPLGYETRVAVFRQVAEARARRLDVIGWLPDTFRPIQRQVSPVVAREVVADLEMNGHRLQSPVDMATVRMPIELPDLSKMTAARMRSAMPAPTDGVASVSILGFSPFAVEAFKLTKSGAPAVSMVQESQNLTWPFYIAINSGVVTLGDVIRKLPVSARRNFLEVRGDTLVIRCPIIVLPGATLLLSGTEFDSYLLSADFGAFLTVAGTLWMQDAELVGWDERNNAPARATEKTKEDFRPFITAWGGSDLELAGSRLAMLGYDQGKSYGLTQSSGASVETLYSSAEKRPTGNIVDNSFDNFRYGYYSYEAEDVNLVGNEYRDNVVYGIDPHDRSRRLNISLNTSYHAEKKHGIIVSRDVVDSFIVGNLSFANHGSGLMLDRNSDKNVVYANTASHNDGDGLTFYESSCNFAAANDLTANRRSGIKVRNSSDILLSQNIIAKNRGNGADLYTAYLEDTDEGKLRDFVMDPYKQVTTVSMQLNRFEGNLGAINSSGASRVVLYQNRFADQGNNVFRGDLRPLSSWLLRLSAASPLSVVNSSVPTEEQIAAHAAPNAHANPCSFIRAVPQRYSEAARMPVQQ